MKRYGNLYGSVCSYENLTTAALNARKGKTGQRTVQVFFEDFEENIGQLREELLHHTYKTSEYSIFTIHEPKERVIYRLPFRDRVVHWAIMLIVEPIWVKSFTRDTYSCISGRGIHSLLRKLRQDLHDDPSGTTYCLKIDIKKFYPSIDHDIMKSVVRRKIKDAELLDLLDGIIDSVPNGEGVPIGNYLSQFFANLYLSELDHQLKEQYGVRYYYRFADDIVILGADKESLRGLLVAINHYLLSERHLSIKSNYQIFPVESRGIDFVGYVTRHDYVLARKKNKKALCRKVAQYRKQGLSEEQIRLKTSSRVGFMIHANTKHLLQTINLNVVGMKKFSEIESGSGKLEGSKLHIDLILNRTIRLQAYEVGQSKHNSEQCLTIQYEVEEDVPVEGGTPKREWVKHITFTGSKALIDQLSGTVAEDFPVEAKIIKQPIGNDGRKHFYKFVDPD
jgi:retron-type reverse transcriptase